MLAYEPMESCSDPGERAGCTPSEEGRALAMDPQPYGRFVLNAVVGPRLHVTRWLALRLDVRFLGGPVEVLDDRTPEAIAVNEGLGSLANRLTCRDRDVCDLAACRTAFEGVFTVEFGVEVVLVGRRPACPGLSDDVSGDMDKLVLPPAAIAFCLPEEKQVLDAEVATFIQSIG